MDKVFTSKKKGVFNTPASSGEGGIKMAHLDDVFYESGINSIGFEPVEGVSDVFAMNRLTAQGIILNQSGIEYFQAGLYVDGQRFVVAPISSGGKSQFGGGGQSFGLPEGEKIASPQHYANFLDMIPDKVDGVTIVTKNRAVTDTLLEAPGLADVVGQSEGINRITAKYKDKPLVILTGH